MDNHPIPQDVTGFQFRLIGDMTIKQFAYLAVPGVLIVIIWYLPVFFLIKAVLIPILGILGLALAFLPVEGRPLDLMAGNFLKALFTPNQYIFQKSGGQLAFLNLPTTQNTKASTITPQNAEEEMRKKELLTAYIQNSSHVTTNPLDAKEGQFLTTLFSATPPKSEDASTPPTPQATPPIPTPPPAPNPLITTSAPVVPAIPAAPVAHTPQASPSPSTYSYDSQNSKIDNEDALEKQAEEIQHELEEAKIKEATQHSVEESKVAHDKVVELDKKLQEILSEKQKLEDELVALKKQLGKDPNSAKIPSQAVDTTQSQNVRKIPQTMSKKVGMPTPPDVPNLLMGIIKDSRGNVLPNILIEVKDQQGNPVRAFKTNPLGQFASATALQKGVYTLSFEDPQEQHKFELIELTVDDKIIQPLEIISVDAREELRQQLFS